MMAIRRAALCVAAGLLAGVHLPTSAGDTGSLWLRPRVGPLAEVVVRRATAGPMPFTITSRQAQVIGDGFQVIGPFGVPVYTVPAPPYVFGAGETSVTATSLVLVPGEYRIRFGGQGLFLRVEVPGSPVVFSNFVFAANPAFVEEPVSGSYTFRVPDEALDFGIILDVADTAGDDYAALDVRDDYGTAVASYACGGANGPYPEDCDRLPVEVPAGHAGSYWSFDLTHAGDVVLALDSVPFALATDAAQWFEPYRFVVDPVRAGGRDCVASLGGTWNPATARCVVQDWQFHAGDTLEVREGATLIFEGAVPTTGTIDNRGTLINEGAIESAGTFANGGRFVNRGTLAHTGSIANTGIVDNHGFVANDGEIANDGVWSNHCTGIVDGPGAFTGNAILPDGIDADRDGVCEVDDCAPDDSLTWAVPGPVGLLAMVRDHPADGAMLAWLPPSVPGSTAVAYDVLRSDGADMNGASCLGAGLVEPGFAEAAVPAEGAVFFYLARAFNACGVGAAGTDSAGVPRTLAACSRSGD